MIFMYDFHMTSFSAWKIVACFGIVKWFCMYLLIFVVCYKTRPNSAINFPSITVYGMLRSSYVFISAKTSQIYIGKYFCYPHIASVIAVLVCLVDLVELLFAVII